ncbi:MAG: hypothetical protein Q8O04_12090 [Deltaproteobacteria bacterium]|nr:hypothetical protein [Deltaproteobacteria bacterium]
MFSLFTYPSPPPLDTGDRGGHAVGNGEFGLEGIIHCELLLLSSRYQPSLRSGRLDDVVVSGEDPDAGDGGKVTAVGDDLHHTVVFHRKPVHPEHHSGETGCLNQNGGGGGSRTRVRRYSI